MICEINLAMWRCGCFEESVVLYTCFLMHGDEQLCSSKSLCHIDARYNG